MQERRVGNQQAIVQEEVALSAIELTHVELPAGSPSRKRHVLLDGQLWSQAEQLHRAAHAIREENVVVSAATKVTDGNIER